MSDSYVCSKAKIKCSFGDKISTLTVFPTRTIWLTGEPQANISDHVSMMNIAPFGKCHTVSYPATGSATAAAHGKLTPMPCVPNTPFPWIGGKSDVLLKGQPALLKSSKCKCVWGGTITITFDGQSSVANIDNSREGRINIAQLDASAELDRKAKNSIANDIDLSEEALMSNGLSEDEAKDFKKSVLNARRDFAKKFYEDNTAYTPEEIESHISCINFEKPIQCKTIPMPDTIVQYQYGDFPGKITGNYATPDLEAGPSKLGTYGYYCGKDGKIQKKTRQVIKISDPIVVLESTANPATDKWSLSKLNKKVNTEGGALQYFIPKK